MSTFTMAQYTALKEAYAMGVTTVQYVDRTVTYRSVTDMQRILRAMESDLFPNAVNPKNTRIQATFCKGTD